MKFQIFPSNRDTKKWTAVFTKENGRTKTINFGAKGYEDYTQHQSPQRKALYISRHRSRENWEIPDTPGSLSRWILWETPNFMENVRLFKKRFKLE